MFSRGKPGWATQPRRRARASSLDDRNSRLRCFSSCIASASQTSDGHAATRVQRYAYDVASLSSSGSTETVKGRPAEQAACLDMPFLCCTSHLQFFTAVSFTNTYSWVHCGCQGSPTSVGTIPLRLSHAPMYAWRFTESVTAVQQESRPNLKGC